ncbi:MAG: acyltransferase family protein [Muribaculaceae bacterium]
MKQRLVYFDILKGMAIFMVVMGHVLTMCVREIDRAALFKFLGEIHMPLFFFISGWFTMRISDDGRIVRPRLSKRFTQLLVPMVVMSSLWIWYFPHSGLQSPLNSTFQGLWLDEWKNGYWFTMTLLEVILIYTLIVPLLNRCRGLLLSSALIMAVWAALLVLCEVLPAEFLGVSSFRLTARFFPVFVAGALAARYKDGFEKLCAKGSTVTVAFIAGAALLYFICWPWEFKTLTEGQLGELTVTVARSIFHILLAILAISLVRTWGDTVFTCPWQYMGRKSLAIYLMHYFFLFPVGVCRETLVSMGLGFTPLFVFSAVSAICIIAVTLMVEYIVSKSPLLSAVLIGNMPARKKLSPAAV